MCGDRLKFWAADVMQYATPAAAMSQTNSGSDAGVLVVELCVLICQAFRKPN